MEEQNHWSMKAVPWCVPTVILVGIGDILMAARTLNGAARSLDSIGGTRILPGEVAYSELASDVAAMVMWLLVAGALYWSARRSPRKWKGIAATCLIGVQVVSMVVGLILYAAIEAGAV